MRIARVAALLATVVACLNALSGIAASAAEVSGARIALVVGNRGYGGDLGTLQNPVNDAGLIAETLRGVGFAVTLVKDANERELEDAVVAFGADLRRNGNGGVALFYYAGHGVQSSGANYLIPVGAQVESEQHLKTRTVPATLVLEEMEAGRTALNIVVLDACRNNPYAASGRSVGGSRGLARMDTPPGSFFLAYSAAAGQVAEDGDGANSVYTGALATAMKRRPGLELGEVFKEAGRTVREHTGGAQVPWRETSWNGAFHFVPPGNSPVIRPDPTPEPVIVPIFPPLHAVVFFALLLILVVAAFFVAPSVVAVVRHGRILADHARNEDASKGLLHLEDARRHWLLRFVPEPPTWRSHEREFQAIERRLAGASRQKMQADIEQAWAHRRPYRAVALTDELLSAVGDDRRFEEDRQKLLAGRTGALEGPLLATVASGQGQLEVHVGEHIDIGREKGDASGIVLSYERISRLGRQCRLAARGGRASVAELGSTNGSWLDDRELASGGVAPIDPSGVTLALGGERGPVPKKGYCRLLLRPCGRAAVGARLDDTGVAAIHDGAEWPNFEHERSTHWLCIFPGGWAEIHLAKNQSLTVEPAGLAALFRLHCGKGLEVGPADGAESIVIDGEVIRAPVPWQPGAVVRAGGQEYQLRQGGLS